MDRAYECTLYKSSVGFGLVLDTGVFEARPVVKTVRPGTPAANAGINNGDVIIAINGVNTKNQGHKSAVEYMKRNPRVDLKILPSAISYQTFEAIDALSDPPKSRFPSQATTKKAFAPPMKRTSQNRISFSSSSESVAPPEHPPHTRKFKPSRARSHSPHASRSRVRSRIQSKKSDWNNNVPYSQSHERNVFSPQKIFHSSPKKLTSEMIAKERFFRAKFDSKEHGIRYHDVFMITGEDKQNNFVVYLYKKLFP